MTRRRPSRGNRTFCSPFVRMYRSGERTKGSLASASGGGLPASQWRGDTRQRELPPCHSRLSLVQGWICSFLYLLICMSIKKAKNTAEKSHSDFIRGVSFVRLIPQSRNRIQRTRPPFTWSMTSSSSSSTKSEHNFSKQQGYLHGKSCSIVPLASVGFTLVK